jgi:CheY-like chemotaxis protein
MATKKPAPTHRRSRNARKPRRQRTVRSSATETALAALAHEFRTPLTGILALSELLATADLPERERQWAAAVKSAAEHIAQLTTLVVDGAKAGSRKLALRAAPFRLRALVDEVAASLSARAQAKRLAADIGVAPDLPEVVTGDAVRLRAALENLIDNAVKFTEVGRVGLDVCVDKAARGRVRLRFTISDTGVGLSAREIKRLFRPFAQADGAGRFGGAGLGLVFVRRLAKAMGGDVTVESAPGHGSRFFLEVAVDVVCDAPASERTKSADRIAREAESLRLLCAEDNPYGRVVLNTILVELGHRVDFVGSGEAAVEAVERGGYDVVLMDITLPGVNGIEAARRIRALPGASARIPIIGISGRTAAREEAAAHAAGMNAYLAKPVSPSRLSEILRSLAQASTPA